MSNQDNTTSSKSFNNLGYLATLTIFANIIVGWLPIAICFYSYEHSIGDRGWIGQWALWELIFFNAAAFLALMLNTFRVEFKDWPEGWHFMRAFSIFPTEQKPVHFGRIKDSDAAAVTLREIDLMTDDDDDRARGLINPGAYTSGPPKTTLPERLTLGDLPSAFIGTKLEGIRQRFMRTEIGGMRETLDEQTKINHSLQANIDSRTGVIESDANHRYAPARAERKNQLDEKRDNLKAAEIDRDIDNMRNRPNSPATNPKRSYAEEVAEKLKRGAMGPHAVTAEEEIKKHAAQWGGEQLAPQEFKDLYIQIRQDAARKDKILG